MKKSLLTLLCVTVISIGMIVSTGFIYATANTDVTVAGDLNGDRTLDISDVSQLLDMLSIGEHTHIYTEVVKDATCTTDGSTVKKCGICGHAEFLSIRPALGHDVVEDGAVAPTCTAPGMTAGNHCARCAAVLKEQTELPPTGHTVVVDEAVAPTCTETGLTEGSHCSVCNTVFTAQQTVAAMGHQSTVLPPKDATCTEPGHGYDVICSVCGLQLSADSTVPPLGHNFSNGSCTRCGASAPYIATGECGADLTWTLYKHPTSSFYYSLVINGNGAMNDYSTIDAPWHSYCGSIKSITLPGGLSSIGNNAFRGCSYLTTITLPENVRSIGSHAFNGCSLLTEINIPSGVTAIGDYAFWSCSSLAAVLLPEGITSIGTCTFYDCRSLTSITVPESVTYIGREAFYYCAALTSIHFEGTVEEWNAITKGYHWNISTGKYTVYCSDGIK